MKDIIQLQLGQMASAYIFILILLFIVRTRGISREKEILIATLRMTLQLMLTGYILVYLFSHPHPAFTLLVIAVMETFAILNIYKRVKVKLSIKLKQTIAIAMISGSLFSLLYFILVVIRLSPWFEPRYFIPIAGMLIGNSMTGISLGANKLAEGMRSHKDLIETSLMLGATPKASCKTVLDSAFDSAILPTINSMVGMGIVSLPGMMTGQILSGTSPLTAIQYQISIMLGISGSVALTVILFVQLGYKSYFNKDQQLEL